MKRLGKATQTITNALQQHKEEYLLNGHVEKYSFIIHVGDLSSASYLHQTNRIMLPMNKICISDSMCFVKPAQYLSHHRSLLNRDERQHTSNRSTFFHLIKNSLRPFVKRKKPSLTYHS